MSFFCYTNPFFELPEFLNDPYIYVMELQASNNLDLMLPFPMETQDISEQLPVDQEEVHVKIEPRSPESTCSRLYMTSSGRPKIFSCSYCNRSFARKYDVARHKRIHTGIKPYICPCCNKGFARSDARVRHFRTEFSCKNGADKLNQHRKLNKKRKGTT